MYISFIGLPSNGCANVDVFHGVNKFLVYVYEYSGGI